MNDMLRRRGLLRRVRGGPAEVDPSRLRWLKVDADVVEGHLSHLLPVARVVVLRCVPARLEKRLLRRGYSAGKARENAEAEAIGVIAQEARAARKETYEIDTTGRRAGEVARDVLLIQSGRGRGFRRRLDMSEGVLAWY
jgi:adenylate kinase